MGSLCAKRFDYPATQSLHLTPSSSHRSRSRKVGNAIDQFPPRTASSIIQLPRQVEARKTSSAEY